MTLKEKLAQFDEKFIVKDRAGRRHFVTMNELSLFDDVRNFLSQTVKELLEEMVVESKEIPHYKCQNSLAMCDSCIQRSGYNSARQSQIEKMNEILK